MTTRIRRRHLVLLAGATTITAALMAAPQSDENEVQASAADRPTTQAADDPIQRPANPLIQDHRTEVRAFIERLGQTPASYGESSVTRELTTAEVILPGQARWRPAIRNADAARQASLAGRAANRAFDGAPPVMPHSRNFAKTQSCLDCHANGIWLGDRFGPPLSHPHLTSCTQCHVEAANLDLPIDVEPVMSSFRGTTAPIGGEVAWEGAPPVMPHGTMMRSRCLSCHGPNSYPGLRIDHPHRLNCVQCHAPAASLDPTSPFFTGSASMLEGIDEGVEQ